jgi:hypothetical protein
VVATLKPHVFISHVREDAARVERLASELEARGIGTWIDRHKIKPGERWEKAIEDAIRSGAFFIACFSRTYAARASSYMNEELHLASREVRRRPANASWFIPVRLDDCEIPDWPIGPELSIRSFQWLDMFPDWATSVKRLAEAIGSDTANVWIDRIMAQTDKVEDKYRNNRQLSYKTLESLATPLSRAGKKAESFEFVEELLNRTGDPAHVSAGVFVGATLIYNQLRSEYYDQLVELATTQMKPLLRGSAMWRVLRAIKRLIPDADLDESDRRNRLKTALRSCAEHYDSPPGERFTTNDVVRMIYDIAQMEKVALDVREHEIFDAAQLAELEAWLAPRDARPAP